MSINQTIKPTMKTLTREEAIKIAEDRNKLGFEGDAFIFEEIKKLVAKHNVKHIVETGTYKGHTTKKLAELCPVMTCEINETYFHEASKNLQGIKNIVMYRGNSVDGLREWLPMHSRDNSKKVLFWLDAHWLDACPLLEELQVIAEVGLKPIICIHDFKVPGFEKDLGFDSHKGKDFDFEYIKEALLKIYDVEFVYHYNTPETSEGAKRGVIYIEPS